MGTDINLFVERRQADGSWEHACGEGNEARGWGWYDERDSRLFGILAGVRDKTVTPIVPRRGCPPDMSDFVRERMDFVYAGRTWYTLRELQAVDWQGLGVGDFARVVDKIATVGEPDDVRVIIGFD